MGGASGGFWALSRHQDPGDRGPRGALGLQGPSYQRAPGAPEGPWAPHILGPNLGPLGPYPLCGFHNKKKSRFPRVLRWKIQFVLLLSQSKQKKRRYSIADDIFLGVLQCEIRIVLWLSLSQQQYNGNLPLQKMYF